MSIALDELVKLTRQEDARLTITVDRGIVALVAFKRPRRAAERVVDHADARYPAHSVEGMLNILLQRLGYAGVPTTANLVERMTPRQRQRCRDLLAQIGKLKREVLTPIEEFEPCLASPRSSLNPRFMAPAHEL